MLHYAGEVEYTVDGFLDKCRDRMPDDLAHLMGESEMPLLSQVLFPAGIPGSIVHALAMLEHANKGGSAIGRHGTNEPPPRTRERADSGGGGSARRWV